MSWLLGALAVAAIAAGYRPLLHPSAAAAHGLAGIADVAMRPSFPAAISAIADSAPMMP